jgi:CheY-like chemotaxis protein
MRRILVVDDDPHIGLAIRAWLKRYGSRVSIADGGTTGLAALDKATFDLMIVDIFMPNMRGFESVRIFHEHAPSVPLIAALLGVIDERLSDAEPHRRHVAMHAAVTSALSEPHGIAKSSSGLGEEALTG